MSSWRALYRLQLTPDFGFRAARELVPYFQDLGVSHLYLSPVLKARRGSTHGYDVVDPTRISDELGGEDQLRALCHAGLGVVFDVVPNHMATSEEENPFWADPDLRLRFFDVDPETGWHRRFFDTGELGGVRVEDPEVFATTHAKVLELVREGLAQGLRIDHPDGLADPAGYLRRLQAEDVEHVWVEKILEPGEELRDWPVAGTTGYEFANDVTALFVDPAGEEPLTELYAELTGERRTFAEVAAEAKLEQARTTFHPEVERLRRLNDHPRLEEAVASLHVYRTYITRGHIDDEDRLQLAHLPEDLQRALFEGGDLTTRFQQTTPAVMAKGVEDTAFYRYNRLLALNEVGGDPGRFGISVEDFHRGNLSRAERFPLHLLATSTHDTKRSGDVRARLAALAGMPEEWGEHVRRWHAMTRGLEDPKEEYLLWQTLVGTWPIAPDRLEAYLEKALREAKVNTSWIEPNLGWEGRVKAFARALYDDRAFLSDFEPFAARVAAAGDRIALGMTLLKLTAPGVPDLYQGDELEALHLVDPDNRRPVDWERRRRALGDPPPKLRTVLAALDLRRRHLASFAGTYEPIEAGPDVCAFRRGTDVLVAVPLRGNPPEEPGGSWRNLLEGLPVGLYEGAG